jgi:hypothetical protein
MSDDHANKVFIRSPDGAYLTGAGTQWTFTPDRIRATVFDFVRDRVAEQIAGIRNTHRLALVAVAVDPEEIHETCDACEQIVAPSRAFFDGKQFLCLDCREDTSIVRKPL